MSFDQLLRGNCIILSGNLSFVDNFVKCSIGCWADVLAALLTNEDTGISNLSTKDSLRRALLRPLSPRKNASSVWDSSIV